MNFLVYPLHVPIPENDAPNEVEQMPNINQSESPPEEKLNDIIIKNQAEIIPNEVEHDMQEIDNMHDLNDYQLTRDRNKRTIRKPERYRDCNLIDCNMSEFAFNVFESLECNEPKTYREALRSKYSEEWISAMKSEMKSLRINQIWKLVPKPASCSVVDCK
ncbi:uncharacterized protein LOC109846218 [Asparagus officinalis]|uniref:uncharacterized protein LOC109846218 n=1 Tax=Asparagus officinalis TaxID=4686 RepID=UPI00098E43AC|nr:uncharacterized protein LOC109846218 [Asparagus officinalis]